MERYSDEAIRIINELHTERLDYQSEYIPLIDAAQRLDAYEATGVEPENICTLQEELNQYKELGDLHRLRELVQADREGRIHIIPIPRRNTCGKCGNFVRVSGRTFGECKLRPNFMPYQSRVCCRRYFEKALEEMEIKL